MNAPRTETLDELVPRFDAAGADWQDVLRRAGLRRPRRGRSRVLAAAVLVAVLVPATSFGVRALLGSGRPAIELSARLHGAFAADLTLDLRHVLLTRRGGRRVPHVFGRLGPGGGRHVPRAVVRWSLEQRGRGAAATSIELLLRSGRRAVLCSPCLAGGGSARVTPATVAALVSGGATAVAARGTGSARGRVVLTRPR